MSGVVAGARGRLRQRRVAALLRWFTFAALAFGAVGAHAATLEVQPTETHLEVAPFIDVLVDPTARRTFADVHASADFRPWGRAGVPAFGFVPDAVWARVTLSNPADVPLTRWLEVDQPTVDDLALWVDGEGPRVAGRMHPVAAEEWRRRSYAFRIDLPPRATRTLHLRVSGENEVQFPLVLWEAQALTAHDTNLTLGLGLLYGLLVAMVLYNALIFLFVRDRAHLYYSLYVTCFALWLASLDGTLPLLLADSVHAYPRWPALTGAAGMILALQFARTSLDVATARPRLDRVLAGAMGFVVLWHPFAVAFLSWRAQNIANTSLAAFLIFGLVITTGILRWRDGLPTARYFTIAWALLVAFLGLQALTVYGFISFIPLGLLPHFGFTAEALTMAAGLADAERRRNEHIVQLNEASRRFVPVEFLALLGRRALPDVREGDQIEREMTVFFSDVRGFTSLVEGLSPAATFAFVNDYLRVMEPPITEAGGFIDKYIGDAVMALFERPADAVAAARGCLEAVAALSEKRMRAGLPPVRIGIGLHTGQLVLGTVGGTRRLACTVIGDSVNLASRVESLTKLYATPLLLTEATARGLPVTTDLREIDRVVVAGRTEPVVLHEVLTGDQPLRSRTSADFAAAREALVRGEARLACAHFERVLAADPHDGPARTLYERARAFETDGLPTGWDGAYRARSK